MIMEKCGYIGSIKNVGTQVVDAPCAIKSNGATPEVKRGDDLRK